MDGCGGRSCLNDPWTFSSTTRPSLFPPSFARDVVRWADERTVVMAEFNMMHEPTDPGTSEMLQSTFGIDATGWVGCAFEDLQDAGPRVRSLHSGAWE